MKIQRREFLTLLGGAAAAWPTGAGAQQRALPVIGYFDGGAPEPNYLVGFRKGLAEAGYVEGQNVAIEYRWAYNQDARLSEIAAELVRRRVAVITIPNGTLPALAAKAATKTIPIVFGTGGDPVQAGLVASLNRPGGNLTGATNMASELAPKRLGLLHAFKPDAKRFAALFERSNTPNIELLTSDLQKAAADIGRSLDILYAGTSGDIDAAFERVKKQADGLVVMPSPSLLFNNRRVHMALAAMHYAVPAIYPGRAYAQAGGLMSYGSDAADLYRQVGIYTGRVLKGEKPADLPVVRATKFEFIINLQVAKLLNLTIPPTVLALADEVIE